MNKHIHFVSYILCLCTLLSISIIGIAKVQPPPINVINPLNRQIRMNLPHGIKHVDQAVLYVLRATPYKLALGYPASGSASIIAMQPVSPEAFEGSVMTIADALLILIGEDNQLLIDADNKLISFEQVLLYSFYSFNPFHLNNPNHSNYSEDTL